MIIFKLQLTKSVIKMQTKTIYAIQHIAFEDLGALEDIFYQKGFRIRYFEAGVDDLTTALNYDGLTIILGGPIGLSDIEDYPFLKDEIRLLKNRLAENKPTLGICLGAQLIAHALGARVYQGEQKEIGWHCLDITPHLYNILHPLKDVPVLHWHGDTFELPSQAMHLASSALYTNQAFSIGHNILALQFHIEVEHDTLEKWLIGHIGELRQTQINVPQLRQDNKKHALKLMLAAREVIQRYLEQIQL